MRTMFACKVSLRYNRPGKQYYKRFVGAVCTNEIAQAKQARLTAHILGSDILRTKLYC